jgi:adenosylcobyric acid synthase
MNSALLVAGTTSDAGKSTIVAGICRWLYRQGVRVAPFKSQNMSNNSVVALDADGVGGEIGRAKAMQAAACGLAPSVAFNPVLLKPGGDMRSQVILRGEPVGDIGAGDFLAGDWRTRLSTAAYQAFDDLRAGYDVVIAEGAGSPTEINLRASDYVNMGLARHGQVPVIVAGDIDRGGVFAALHGTLALLDRADQALIAGFVINKFRGDADLLEPGLALLEKATGRPTLGVVPWSPDLWIDAEDSLAYPDGRVLGRPAPPVGDQWLRVAAVRLPHLSNATDLEALAAEPGVLVRVTTSPAEVADADLVVLPGSKATVADLDWLREAGLATAITAHADAGHPVLGICGGFQMLASAIDDDVESGRGRVTGLGLLPIDVTFASRKTLRHAVGTGFGTAKVRGYEIHHGYVSSQASRVRPLIERVDGTPEGAVSGSVYGTHWHGAFESDEFRRRFLAAAARDAGRAGFAVAPATVFADRRSRLLDVLGDLVAAHLDTAALWRLIEYGAPAGLPFVPPGAP